MCLGSLDQVNFFWGGGVWAVGMFIGGSIDGFMWWVFKYFVSGFVGCFLMGLKVMNKWFWGGFFYCGLSVMC
jgi:hypothetical protein